MPNYKITIKYDGTNFFGWQSQPEGNTIQDEISKAVSQISQEKINLIGAGRTDSGVHAIGQVANFSLSKELQLYKFQHSLNCILPKTISISKMEFCDDNFNARFDAKRRTYIYIIGKNKNPFYENYSYNYPQIRNINLELLKILTKKIIGEFDFTSFCKTNTETQNKICNVLNCVWRENKEFLIFKIDANRFLHGMVRTIVGTLLSAAFNKNDENYIEEILKSKNRIHAGEAVPSKGLYLYKVKY
ncbi:MAG: tRNA pseudouridine(38-40) synthase TruA [Ignavibacteriae bacterium]|nr:tRNA pseudouridine(38-40) synthase TruA [Ignavibacteriota bacterium]